MARHDACSAPANRASPRCDRRARAWTGPVRAAWARAWWMRPHPISHNGPCHRRGQQAPIRNAASWPSKDARCPGPRHRYGRRLCCGPRGAAGQGHAGGRRHLLEEWETLLTESRRAKPAACPRPLSRRVSGCLGPGTGDVHDDCILAVEGSRRRHARGAACARSGNACSGKRPQPGRTRRAAGTARKGTGVTFAVTEACVGCKDTACVAPCPMGCFLEGPDLLAIEPSECIDCAMCVPECPVDAIRADVELVAPQQAFVAQTLQRAHKDGWPRLTRPLARA